MRISIEEIKQIYNLPLLELVFQAATVHRKYHNSREVQQAALLSIKTGQCVEDCAYCPQSARYSTQLANHKLLAREEIIQAAENAKKAGASRFCMGAAFREIKNNNDFEDILTYVREVNGMGLEVCCTLGMLNSEQATRLKQAGLKAYNHNLDSSQAFYKEIISTRTYQERLDTLETLHNAQISICSGGIIGMGENDHDRIELLYNLANLPSPPESVPINALVPVKGTPLENAEPINPWIFIRMVATARIVMPKSKVRLSAGRRSLNQQTQALCFLAGANSIFIGDKLLTTANNDLDEDSAMFAALGLKIQQPKKEGAYV